MYEYMYIYIYIHIFVWCFQPDPPAPCQAAPNVRLPCNMPLLRLQRTEGECTMSREIEPVRRSLCRHGSCMFTEVAHLVPSGRARERTNGLQWAH